MSSTLSTSLLTLLIIYRSTYKRPSHELPNMKTTSSWATEKWYLLISYAKLAIFSSFQVLIASRNKKCYLLASDSDQNCVNISANKQFLTTVLCHGLLDYYRPSYWVSQLRLNGYRRRQYRHCHLFFFLLLTLFFEKLCDFPLSR